MVDDALRDAEGRNRLVTLLLGAQALRARAVRALAVPSAEAPLDTDNPAVLAALGLLALQAHLDGWLPTPTGPPAGTDAPSPVPTGSLWR